MRISEVYQLIGRTRLMEGGNVFPDVVPFAQKNAQSIFNTVQKIMPQGIQLLPVGSAGHKAMSGDMDVQVDEKQVMEYFSSQDPKAARAALKQYFINNSLESALTGINVHVKVPSPEGYAQVDIMFVSNAKNVSQFHNHDYANTKYKGAHKHIVLSSLAKYTTTVDHTQGFIWSAFQGLKDRATKEFVTDDPTAVAQMLVAPDATPADLRSVEAIVAKLPQDQYGKLKDAQETLAKEGVTL